MTVALAFVGLGAAQFARQPQLAAAGSLPWWAMAAAFAVTETFVLRARGRSGGRPVSLSGVPLVVGAVLVQPGELVFACVLGTVVALLAARRYSVATLAFRAALAAAGAAAVVVLLRPLLGGAAFDEPRAWAAIVAATTVAAVLESACSLLLDVWIHGDPPGWHTLRAMGVRALYGTLVGCLGIVVVVVFDGGAGTLPVVVGSAMGLVGYRAYATLADRHADLARIYALSDALADTPDLESVVEVVLTHAVDLVQADYAELAVRGLDGEERTTRWAWSFEHGLTGPEHISESALPAPFPPHRSRTLKGDTLKDRNALMSRGVSSGVAVPIVVDEQVAGHLLVADRSAELGGFSGRYVRLLETVANQSNVALRNGRLVERLRLEARRDELTGLPNRLELRDVLDTAAVEAARGGRPCAVMVLDFNGFKAINDTLGHEAGDILLQVLAKRLADAAAGEAVVARLGGDEFAVLAVDCPGAEAAMALGWRLLGVFDEPVAVHGARLRLGGSIGVALGAVHGADGSDLLRNADIAMYAAKTGGTGCVMYSDDLVEVSVSTLNLGGDLRDALLQGEVDIVVQPLIRLSSGALHSVEVLARWTHPEHGEIAPETFFQAAERSGLTPALSQRILERALEACREWHAQGVPVRVAVNLAPRWFADPSLPDQLEQALATHGVPSDLLCLELTENGVIADHRRAVTSLARLREMGVHLSLDDFGTGYSSLGTLSRLPIDQMKIDKSFVERMAQSAGDRAIVQSVIDLARNMNLEVVAEGVSDVATRDILQKMGCQLGQGYLFSRPLTVQAMTAILLGHRGVPGVPGTPGSSAAPGSPAAMVPMPTQGGAGVGAAPTQAMP